MFTMRPFSNAHHLDAARTARKRNRPARSAPVAPTMSPPPRPIELPATLPKQSARIARSRLAA